MSIFGWLCCCVPRMRPCIQEFDYDRSIPTISRLDTHSEDIIEYPRRAYRPCIDVEDVHSNLSSISWNSSLEDEDDDSYHRFSEMDSESNRSRLTEMRKWRTSPVRRSHEHHPPAARSLQQVKDHQRQLHQHQPPRCLTNRLRESRQSAGRRTPRLPKTSAQDVSSPRRLTKATRSTSLAGTAKRRIP